MGKWIWTIRVVGFTTACLAADGIWELISFSFGAARLNVTISGAPFFHEILIWMNAAAGLLLMMMLTTSVVLLRRHKHRVKVFLVAYLLTIIYFVFTTVMGIRGSGAFRHSFAAAYGVGNLALAPLILMPYPLVYAAISMSVVFLAGQRLNAYDRSMRESGVSSKS